MSISTIPEPFYLLSTFVLIVQAVVGVDPLFHFCSSTNNFTANGPYDNNLNKLTSYLASQTPPTGFSDDSFGQTPDKVYGLALCRGDVASSDCKTCVVDATDGIRQRCPYNKGAVIWYDNCLLKYSEFDFLGQIDDENKFYMWNTRMVNDSTSFNAKTKELLTRLAKEAYVTPKLYAAGQLVRDAGAKQMLYGLVQCTRDLNSLACKECLDGIIGELPSCCDGKEGGRVISGSCNFRYEIYPFVNA